MQNKMANTNICFLALIREAYEIIAEILIVSFLNLHTSKVKRGDTTLFLHIYNDINVCNPVECNGLTYTKFGLN